jgi:hypothetical protein
LENGGKLVFDVFIGLMEEQSLSPAGEVVDGEWVYKRFVGAKVLPEKKLEVQLIYEMYREGMLAERIEERSFAGVISRERVHRLLKKSGFEVEAEFGNYQREPFQEKGDLLIIQASKGK